MTTRPLVAAQQSVLLVILTIACRLVRRLVEWPLAVVFGIMVTLLVVSSFSWGNSQAALNFYAAFLKFAILLPLGMPSDQDGVDLGTEQTFLLFSIWYTVYLVIIELAQWGWRRLWPGRSLPTYRIVFGSFVVGYVVVAVVIGFIADKAHGFVWWPTGMAVFLVGVTAVSLWLSWLIGRFERSLRIALGAQI
jgi:hypothetical protein